MGQALENNLYDGSQVGFDQLLETNRELSSRNAVLESLNSFLESQKAELESRNAEMEARLNQMQFQVDQMARLLYGAKRERYIGERDEKQMVLPFDVEPLPEPEKQQETISYVRPKPNGKTIPGGCPFPATCR